MKLASGTTTQPGMPTSWRLDVAAFPITGNTTLPLTLPAGRALTLAVLKADDTPLAGAQVTGLSLPVARVELAPGMFTASSSQSGPASARTDSAGRSTISVFASTPAPAQVEASADNPLTLFQIPSVAADTTLTVRAGGASRVHVAGTVRLSGGRELAGSSVTIDGPEHSQQQTARDGTYSASVSPGAYQLTVTGSDGGIGLPQQWSLPLETTSIQLDRTFDIGLPAVHTVTLAVHDEDDHPLAGARVTGLSLPVAAYDVAPGVRSAAAARSGPGTVVTGSDGTVSFQAFTSTPTAAEIAAGDHNPTTRFEVPSITHDTRITVRADGLTRVKLNGRVTTSGGAPVRDVRAELAGPDATAVSTGSDGAFAAALTPGVYQLQLSAPTVAPTGLPAQWSLPSSATSVQTDRDVSLALPPVHHLRIKVLGADNQPLAGARLTGLQLPVAVQQVAPGIRTTSAATSGSSEVTTDDDGEVDVLVFPSDAGRAELAAGPANPRVSFDVPAVTDDASVIVRVSDHVDVVAPHIVCAAHDSDWHADDVSVPCTAEDGGSGLAQPAEASFVLHTNVPAGSESASAATDTKSICDVAGNCATAGPITHLKVDRQAPNAACAAPSDVWSASDVSIVCTPRDGGAGLSPDTPSSLVLTTSAAAGVESAAAVTSSRAVCDAVGNCRSAGPLSARVDRRPPTIDCSSAPRPSTTNVHVTCHASDGGAGLANTSDATFELTTAVGSGKSDHGAMTGTHEVCDGVGNCVTAGPLGPFDVSVSAQSSADADHDGTPDSADFCPTRAGACVPEVPGANAQDRARTAEMATRAIAAGCAAGTSAPGAWASVNASVRRRSGASAATAVRRSGDALCDNGVMGFAVAQADLRPDPHTNDAYVFKTSRSLAAANGSCRSDKHCTGLVTAANGLATAAATFGAASLDLTVARNRLATALVDGRKNDAALQEAMVLLGEGNLADAQRDAAAAGRKLEQALKSAGVDERLPSSVSGPVLAAMRVGSGMPSGSVASVQEAGIDAAALSTRFGALPTFSGDLHVGQVWTTSGVSSRRATRRKLTLTDLQTIVPNLLAPLGTTTTRRLIAALEAVSSACTARSRDNALQRFRRLAGSVAATRLLASATDPLIMRRHHCG
ncbi:hypothetical protein [Conexibacter woesei]|uniref:hypothetical protein n=1 Tax=Conexibacter woesei TaxID=191495 RepID=UPI001E37B8A1|nr:hypothetical protein [Conexibacter woesei]